MSSTDDWMPSLPSLMHGNYEEVNELDEMDSAIEVSYYSNDDMEEKRYEDEEEEDADLEDEFILKISKNQNFEYSTPFHSGRLHGES